MIPLRMACINKRQEKERGRRKEREQERDRECIKKRAGCLGFDVTNALWIFDSTADGLHQ